MEELKRESWKIPAPNLDRDYLSRGDYPFPSWAFKGPEKHVYVIVSGDDGPVKIGVAKDPFSRKGQLQTGHSSKLNLAEYSKALPEAIARSAEKSLHAQLSKFRMNGEWFTFDGAYPYLYGCYEFGLDITDFVFNPTAVNKKLS